MSTYDRESLISDPLHGYVPYLAVGGADRAAEQTLIDHPWLQRLRRIHQLQSAWWVYPSAEHTRFQHVLGAMHLAGRALSHLYPSLVESCAPERVPSRAYVESLTRIAALLHDVGHGPYGHFFDDQFLHLYDLNHEDLGQRIILDDLGAIIRGIRTNPHGCLEGSEELRPEEVAYLIKRPKGNETGSPHWLRLLRSLFCGIYTVDNMDFVLRDSFMSGHGPRAFDLERLLHYSFFTRDGLTLHEKGVSALQSFLEARTNLFIGLYYHRTVRAIDLMLREVFEPTLRLIFPVNPLDDLPRYRRLTEWSLLGDVEDWALDTDPEKQRLGAVWADVIGRRVRWKMAYQKVIEFPRGQSEQASIFTEPGLVENRVRGQLPAALRSWDFRVDVARVAHLPSSSVAPQNFIYEQATGKVRALADCEPFARWPLSSWVCRLFVHDHEHDAELAAALKRLLQTHGDDRTNM